MKKLNILIFIACIFSFGFLFFSDSENGNDSKLTNYYYYKGQKFYMQERTDLVFLNFKSNISTSAAREILSDYPEIDINISEAGIRDDHFVKLKSKLSEDDYVSLIHRMKSDNNFENVNYAYSPFNINDGKTFYGMNDYLILQFKEYISKDQIDNINISNGVELVERIDVTGGLTFLAKVNSQTPLNAMQMSNKYYEEGFVNYSEPSLYVTNVICDTVNDPFFAQQWSLKNTGNNVPTNPPNVIADADMDVDSAWIVTQGDNAVIVAIVDTGVDTTHADLRLVNGYDFVNNDGNANDDGDHGTACAGIVAATGNNNLGVAGVAYKCRIMPVKIINAAGSIPGYHVAAFGIIWAAQNGADVISNSWGFGGGASSLLYNAVNDAARNGRNGKGSVLCFASGNEDTSPMRFPSISDAEMLVVGGLTPCNKRKSPSDGCSGETWGASFGPTLDIVAPCVKIYTTDRTGTAGYSTGDYTSTFNGTSSATPNCAGVCALLISANQNLTRREVESLISSSAEKVGGYTYGTVKEYGNWNNEMGYGSVNARLALKLLQTGNADNVKPEIFHDSPVLSGRDTLARNVTSVITDNGRVQTGTYQPRLYYRVNSGSFNFVIASSVVTNTFNFVIPGQITNSIVDYYFAAQDTAVIPNVATLPAGGTGINPPGTFPPTAFFSYRIGNYHNVQSVTTPRVCLNNSTTYDTILVSGFTGTVTDVDLKISISNRDDQDVDLFLLKDATQSELTTDNGGSNDGYVNTIFDARRLQVLPPEYLHLQEDTDLKHL